MKLITKDADNAIVALLALARGKGKTMSAAELSGQLGIPHPFMRRILQKLAARGTVASRRGMGGGFTLARNCDTGMPRRRRTLREGGTLRPAAKTADHGIATDRGSDEHHARLAGGGRNDA